MTPEEINFILNSVFKKIKNGELERGWEVYDEFKKQLTDNHDTREEKQFFDEYLNAKELEKQPLTDVQKKCNHKWHKTWTWHSGGFQECTLCGRIETFYERD